MEKGEEGDSASELGARMPSPFGKGTAHLQLTRAPLIKDAQPPLLLPLQGWEEAGEGPRPAGAAPLQKEKLGMKWLPGIGDQMSFMKWEPLYLPPAHYQRSLVSGK